MLLTTCIQCDRPVYAKGLCQSHHQMDWRSKDPARHKANLENIARFREKKIADGTYKDYVRAKNLKRYNLTPEQWKAQLDFQEGKCAICKQDMGEVNLGVDHDHLCCPQKSRSCGKCLRGLLCSDCNLLLGRAKDDIAVLTSAIDYLTNGGSWGI